MPRHLRSVDDDGNVPPEKDGDLAVVIEDLEIAHGHVVEARAEAIELPERVVELDDALMVADAAVAKALQQAHRAKP
jgi:hypothetical protein